jgi:hypothetical protein
MDWLGAIFSGIGTYFGSRSSENQRQAASKDDYKWTARLSAFEKELDDYYTQRDKAEMRRGANEYAKFSSLDRWAPGYTNTFVPNPAPGKPQLDEIEDNYGNI